MRNIHRSNKKKGKFLGGGSGNSSSVSCPLGIAYNNIQITYRNTSLKSSTLEERNVCDLPTDGTWEGSKEEFVKKTKKNSGSTLRACASGTKLNQKFLGDKAE